MSTQDNPFSAAAEFSSFTEDDEDLNATEHDAESQPAENDKTARTGVARTRIPI